MALFDWNHRTAGGAAREQQRSTGGWRSFRVRARVTVTALVVLLALSMSACAASTGAGTTPTVTVSTSEVPGTGTVTVTSGGYPVKVYFSKHPDSDNDPAKVFVVSRTSPTLGVATYAIQQLIAGPSASEQQAGLYTPLTASLSGTSNCGGADFTITLNMRGPKPEQGTATLKFCRATSLAGDLTGGRIVAEINTTLLQFSNIKQVVILTQTGGCFNDFKGTNDCLK